MARLLWPRHGELHVCEEPPGATLTDVKLRLGVRRSGCRADGVEPKLHAELL